MNVTDASANDTQLWQDAWGNPMPNWTSGHWQTGIDRWGHNTKEVDGDTGLVYMYQRWYLGQIASFVSQSKLANHLEARFSFGFNNPNSYSDTLGVYPGLVIWPRMTMEEFFGEMPAPVKYPGYRMADYMNRRKLNNCPSNRPTDLCDKDSNWCKEDPRSTAQFHPGANSCVREVVPASAKGIGGSQCCYDSNGKLIEDGWAAGTYDYVAPSSAKDDNGKCNVDPTRAMGHYQQDVMPFQMPPPMTTW